MAQLIVHADSPERLQGFLTGVAWINDSAVTLMSIDLTACRALLEDHDADADGYAQLGPEGLTWGEDDPAPATKPRT